MDSTHVSEEIMFLLEGNETISFSSSSITPSCKPTEDQIRKKVIGIQLSYAYCGEQDFGIDPMARAFGTNSDGVIQKVPNGLTLDTENDVTILKYGRTTLSPRMIAIAKEIGMAGYWDDSNLIICAAKEYETIIENVIDFIQPNKVRFAFRTVFAGPNFMILSI